MKPTPSARESSVALLPRLRNLGGPASFQRKMLAGLETRGVRSHFDVQDASTGVILVNGGTKHLAGLWRAKKRGIRIIQRLDGINWLHRKKSTGLRHYLRSEYGNWNLSFIRTHLADHIIYQSEFCREWWQAKYGPLKAPANVIYNGVDLEVYTPHGERSLPEDHIRILMVEGHLSGGHEIGLNNAIRLAETLEKRLQQKVELMVVGDVPHPLRQEVESTGKVWVSWAGVLSHEQIPALDRSAHLLFSADLNAACPNSVIEALACGLPVIAFATGALPELLAGEAGALADYGGNHWELEAADIPALANEAVRILDRLPYFRQKARRRAEEAFGLERMLDLYLQALFPQ